LVFQRQNTAGIARGIKIVSVHMTNKNFENQTEMSA